MTTDQSYIDFLDKLARIYEKREAANIADWIFENVTGLKKLDRLLHKKIELSEQEQNKIDNYLYQLVQHRPVQYVLQESWFYKMKFFVNEDVLIPRPETEELISWVVNDVRSTMFDVRSKSLQMLDIGTGSGCIAVSLKKEFPDVNMMAIDVSEKALVVAKKNADILQAGINFLQINFLDESLWPALSKYDVIVSNPPYIPENEEEKLSKNVTAFEPGVALFVQSDSPFIFYEKIAKFAKEHLKTNGKIYVEIHEDYSLDTEQIFKDYHFKTEIKEDIYGRKRMIRMT